MTVQSILEVEVDPNGNLKAFMALHQQYLGLLAKMPVEWRAAAAEASTFGEEVKATRDEIIKQNEIVRQFAVDQDAMASKALATSKGRLEADRQNLKEKAEASKIATAEEAVRQKAEEAHMEKAIKFWRDASSMTGVAARNAASLTKEIVEFGIKGVGLGLIGTALGGFGLGSMASAVNDNRLQAQGLGITYGEKRAFDDTFGVGLGLDSSFIGKVQSLKADRNHWQFGRLGISEDEVMNGDQAKLTADVLLGARRLYQQLSPEDRNAQYMHANGLDTLFDFQQLQRIGNPNNSVEDLIQQFQGLVKKLDVSNSDQRAWQRFITEIKAASDEIEAVFVRGLAPLAAPLGHLAESIADAIRIFLANPKLAAWMKELGDEIEKFARYMGTADFEQDVRAASDKVVEFAEALGKVAQFFIDLTNTGKPVPGHPGLIQTPAGPMGNNTPARDHWWQHLIPNIGHLPWNMPQPPMVGNDGKPIAGSAEMSGTEQKFSLPAGTLTALGMQESGMTAHPRDTFDGNPGEWHRGAFQMSDTMLQRLGVADPYDLAQVIPAAGKEMGGYLDHFRGNLAAAIAAWNQGQPGADKVLRRAVQHGADPQDEGAFLAEETPAVSAYVLKVLAAVHKTQEMLLHHVQRPARVDLRVDNQAGANIAMAANAVR